ncbi:NADPH-dependent F420 reductase [Chondrinema litorale]|uniref:NADPH-dependent F420 reductase n=1 Tax=Chondrinema litorale TaxID=2994555 RepID=UPI002542885F|nr:NAD(P)-binding domain-containing protein [Chondrinema litorale]UZR97295.1 NAD(P)-binding domain-containing protein [Chondrinema litorale]
MKIAVLGTGIVGKTIAEKLNTLGHEVVIGTREVEKTLANKNDEKSFAYWYESHKNIGLQTFKDAAAFAESVIFNCTSGMLSIKILQQAEADSLGDKILIDVANPLDFSNGMPPTLNPGNSDSLAEQIQRAFPNLKVVKTLNTMSSFLMVKPSLVQGDHSIFVSGNDDAAKEAVKEILNSFGWKQKNILDLGDISTARGVEMLLPVWMKLWDNLGTVEFNFHIQQNA